MVHLHDRSKAVIADCAIIHCRRGADVWVWRAVSVCDALAGCGDVEEDGREQGGECEMSEYVWMCNPHMNLRNSRGFWPGLFTDEVPNKFFASQGEIMTKMLAGQPFEAEELPTKFFHYMKPKFKQSLPQVFHSTYVFVNEKAADIFRAHHLGGGGLYPITLYENDKITEIPANICIVNYGNAKDTVILEKSKSIEPFAAVEGTYRTSLPEPEDDDIVVSADSLEGPDIWVDPKMYGCFFVSDRFGRALIKAKVKAGLDMRRCIVAQ
ncbi:MAG: hypothetical protein ACJAUW_000004 [Yoonia sp.]|jgi:hypothetical protein